MTQADLTQLSVWALVAVAAIFGAMAAAVFAAAWADWRSR